MHQGYKHARTKTTNKGLLQSATEKATSRNIVSLWSHTLLRQQQRWTEDFLGEDGLPQTSSAMDPLAPLPGNRLRKKLRVENGSSKLALLYRPVVDRRSSTATRKSRVKLGCYVGGVNSLHFDWLECFALPDKQVCGCITKEAPNSTEYI